MSLQEFNERVKTVKAKTPGVSHKDAVAIVKAGMQTWPLKKQEPKEEPKPAKPRSHKLVVGGKKFPGDGETVEILLHDGSYIMATWHEKKKYFTPVGTKNAAYNIQAWRYTN